MRNIKKLHVQSEPRCGNTESNCMHARHPSQEMLFGRYLNKSNHRSRYNEDGDEYDDGYGDEQGEDDSAGTPVITTHNPIAASARSGSVGSASASHDSDPHSAPSAASTAWGLAAMAGSHSSSHRGYRGGYPPQHYPPHVLPHGTPYDVPHGSNGNHTSEEGSPPGDDDTPEAVNRRVGLVKVSPSMTHREPVRYVGVALLVGVL